MKLSKTNRNILFQKFDGRCAYCGCKLGLRWHADHIQPIKRPIDKIGLPDNPELDNFENLNPSCPPCNINKHSMSIEEFRAVIAKYVVSMNKYSTQYNMAKKFNLIIETDNEVKFYYETYQS
jgi:5-methylcytosine-specific restriction endonuclease McrA